MEVIRVMTACVRILILVHTELAGSNIRSHTAIAAGFIFPPCQRGKISTQHYMINLSLTLSFWA